jgi:Protein of unknown function (DUF2516)
VCVNFSLVGWIYQILDIAVLVFAAWAFVDCLRRRPDAFPAIGRSSKGVWAVLTGLSALYGLAAVLAGSPPMGFIAIAAIVITGLYLLDLRPKLIEVTSGH